MDAAATTASTVTQLLHGRLEIAHASRFQLATLVDGRQIDLIFAEVVRPGHRQQAIGVRLEFEHGRVLSTQLVKQIDQVPWTEVEFDQPAVITLPIDRVSSKCLVADAERRTIR